MISGCEAEEVRGLRTFGRDRRIEMDSQRRRILIEQYRDGHRVVLEALQGCTEAELDVRPAADDWTPREIVHHLADSEMTSAIRVRRLLAEEHPVIAGY